MALVFNRVKMLHDNSFDAYGVDVATKAIEMATELRGETCSAPPCFKQEYMASIPYPDQTFDAGLSADVLEHIAPDDVDKVVSEISRVVKHVLALQIASFPEQGLNGEKVGMGNLHLATEDAAFWDAKFAVHGWSVQEDWSTVIYVNLLLVRH
eukprot:3355595-Amphidinium_carterae.1